MYIATKMKNFAILLLVGLYLTACNSTTAPNPDSDNSPNAEKNEFGLLKVTPGGAITADDLIERLLKEENLTEVEMGEMKVKGIAEVKMEGKIVQMCKAAGCWYTVEGKDGTVLTVSMKEHKSLPKDWVGKTVVAQGTAYVNTISVEELRFALKEEGATNEEIESIEEPEKELNFLAEGVVLKP